MKNKLKRLTKSAFLDSVSEFLRIAKANLQSDGFLNMIIGIVREDGDILVTDAYNKPLIIVEQLREQGRHREAGDLKSEMWNNLRQELAEQKAIGYFTMSDAFISVKELEKGQVAFGEQPGQILLPEVTLPRFDPKRREAIMLNWEWKGPPEGVHSAGQIRQFYRREGNRIILEEVERFGSPAGGPLEGLLR